MSTAVETTEHDNQWKVPESMIVPKVYKAISNIQSELAKIGISKDGTNKMQHYKFRGIDQIYEAIAPLLAKHKLVIVPRTVDRECVERKSNKGGALFYVSVKCDFDFVSAEDGSVHTASMYGEAMDSGDKATNKAMSSAYKYICLQTFCIPTEGDNDADASSHEVETKKSDPKRRGELLKEIEKQENVAMLNSLGKHRKDEVSLMVEEDKKILRDAFAFKKDELEKEVASAE